MYGRNRPGSRESRTQKVTSTSRAGFQAARSGCKRGTAPRSTNRPSLVAVVVRKIYGTQGATRPMNGHRISNCVLSPRLFHKLKSRRWLRKRLAAAFELSRGGPAKEIEPSGAGEKKF